MPLVPPHDGNLDAGKRDGYPLYSAGARPLDAVHNRDLHPCGNPQTQRNPHRHTSREEERADNDLEATQEALMSALEAESAEED